MIKKSHVFCLLGAAVIAFLAENKRSKESLKKEQYVISSKKIPKAFHGKKIVFLSDLHNVELGKDNERLLSMIEEEEPDYIFVGGDMLVSKSSNNADQAVKLMKHLAERYPVYCANGNHEERLLWREKECPEAGEIYRNYIDEITKAGVRHLYNETARISEGESGILVSGLELSEEYYEKFAEKKLPLSYMEERLGKASEKQFHILLAHNPDYFKTYAEWGADLTLSGHLHGGIARLPLLGGVISPSYQLFPKYDAGLFRIRKSRMIVSVGLGSHSIPVRLFNPPKIDCITLVREERE